MSNQDQIHELNGSKTSGHKPNYDLLEPLFLKRIAQRMSLGASHYGRNNWKKGAETKEYTLDRLNHAFEHLVSAIAKINNDLPIGDDDLAACVVNCMFAMYHQEWVKGYDSLTAKNQESLTPGIIATHTPIRNLENFYETPPTGTPEEVGNRLFGAAQELIDFAKTKR